MSNSTGKAPANPHIQKWVKDMAAMCQPENVFWCDGSESEREQLTEVAVEIGDLLPLNQNKLPGSDLHRSALNDVARTENLTFVCTPTLLKAEPSGPMRKGMTYMVRPRIAPVKILARRS